MKKPVKLALETCAMRILIIYYSRNIYYITIIRDNKKHACLILLIFNESIDLQGLRSVFTTNLIILEFKRKTEYERSLKCKGSSRFLHFSSRFLHLKVLSIQFKILEDFLIFFFYQLSPLLISFVGWLRCLQTVRSTISQQQQKSFLFPSFESIYYYCSTYIFKIFSDSIRPDLDQSTSLLMPSFIRFSSKYMPTPVVGNEERALTSKNGILWQYC